MSLPGAQQQNPWDDLGSMFGGHVADNAIPPEAADNILIAWPCILNELETHAPPPATILDFGCGGGRFVAELLKRNYDAIGIDSSEAMIQSALRLHPDPGVFLRGDTSTLSEREPFDVITSIMVMQFVADPVGVFTRLAKRIRPGGQMIIAVHNPSYVNAWTKRSDSKFTMIGNDESGSVGTLQLSDVNIPIFIRDAAAYSVIAEKAKLKPTFQHEPPFTQEFVDRFDWRGPIEYSEYLVMGFTTTA